MFVLTILAGTFVSVALEPPPGPSTFRAPPGVRAGTVPARPIREAAVSDAESPSDTQAPDSIRGHTIRWTWTEGPVEGVTHEHHFRDDGTVEWRVLGGPREGHSAVEEEYAAFRVSDGVYAVSYRAASGYTLTVVLDFGTGEMVGFASGNGQWFPQRGTFELVE